MDPALTEYYEALTALVRPSHDDEDTTDPATDAPRRRKKRASRVARPAGGGTPVVREPTTRLPPELKRVEKAEAAPAVRQSRVWRLVNDANPRARWLLRYAVGCALASACDPALAHEFSLKTAAAVLGDRLGPAVGALPDLAALLARGVLVREDDGNLGLPDGLGAWLMGGDLSAEDLVPVIEDPTLAVLPVIREAALRVAPLLGSARVVVLRTSSGLVAHTFARHLSDARGRGLRAWAHHDSAPWGEPSTVLRAIAALSDDDVFVACSEEAEGANYLTAQDTSAAAGDAPDTGHSPRLYIVVNPSHLGPDDPVLAVDPMIDLRPLCREVERAAAADVGAGSPERLARARAVHEALYPNVPTSEMAPLNDGTARQSLGGRLFGDNERAHLAPALWTVPSETLDTLIVAPHIGSALASIHRSATAGNRAILLLHGPPGTGKSLTARALAGSLGRPLYRLDAALLRGMYYGQLEQRLAEVFAEATRRNAVIVVDEADEWIGRREGSSAQVGGANIQQSSEMLQLLERFSGVAVLTTNRADVLDPALSRRVDAWLHLTIPAMEERMALWVSVLGDAVELSGIDLLLLAAVSLSGGEIVATVREVIATGAGTGTPALLAGARRRSERRALVGD